MHGDRSLHRGRLKKRVEPDDEDEDDPFAPLPSWLVDESPPGPEDELSDAEAMAILYAAGQPISTVDKLSLEEIRFAAHLVQLGQMMRRHDDIKAQISAFGR